MHQQMNTSSPRRNDHVVLRLTLALLLLLVSGQLQAAGCVPCHLMGAAHFVRLSGLPGLNFISRMCVRPCTCCDCPSVAGLVSLCRPLCNQPPGMCDSNGSLSTACCAVKKKIVVAIHPAVNQQVIVWLIAKGCKHVKTAHSSPVGG